MRALGISLYRLAVVVLVVVTVCTQAAADAARVPVALQAQLTARIGSFDRKLKDRAGPVARVVVVHRSGNAESETSATGFARAIAELRVGGLSTAVEELAFTDADDLATRCKAQHYAIAYFAVGLEPEMARVATALVGIGVLTIGASGTFATNGAVVGFDVEEARPKLVLNLRSAKAQNVSFKAELLELARIVP